MAPSTAIAFRAMRAFVFAGVGASPLMGCGMITGLSNDYQFVADDGGGTGNEDASSVSDGSTVNDGAASCAVTKSGFSPQACRTCLPNTCCALAACFDDQACRTYASCRNSCGRNVETCLKSCDNNATSETRNRLREAISKCNINQSCTISCGF